jgi:hypothetical protein
VAIRTRASTAQWRVINSTARFLGFFAGRQFGKTWTAQERIIRRVLRNPGFQYWYVTPFYGQCIEEYEKLLERPDFRRHIARAKMQPFPQVWIRNGSRIGYRSFEKPRTLRGKGVHECWFDEIQDINAGEFWPVTRALTGVRLGTTVVSGQFRGKNWYYKEFYEKGLPGTPEFQAHTHESFRFRTDESAMWQSTAHRAELALIKSQVEDFTWRQEYLCEACSNPNAVWLSEQLDAIVRGEPQKPIPGHVYCMGLDLGRVSDHTVITIIDVATGQCVYFERLPLHQTHPTMAVHCGNIASWYNNAFVVMDATGGGTGGKAPVDSNLKFYRARIKNMYNQGFYWGPANKKPIIEEVTLAIQEQWLKIPAQFSVLLEELRIYEAKYITGFWSFSAPDRMHDDCVQSIAMAIWGARRLGYRGCSGGSLDVLLG